MGLGGRVFGVAPVAPLASLVNGTLAPAWFLWVGFALRHDRIRATA
jgi:hypothetical protein